MNGVSAVLITKNEAKVIGRCIKSLQGLGQVVVHDTGSTDDTVRIAKAMGADVSETKIEPFHFAIARNEAMQRAKNRWILSIDADEVLREGSLGPLLGAVKNSSLSAYEISYEDRAEAGGTTRMRGRMLLFQKARCIWKYRVHERLIPVRPLLKFGILHRCVIEHHPDQDKSARRAQNLDLLKLCIKENPEYFDASRQLGLEYVLLEKWAEAIPHLEAHVRQPVDPADGPFERVASRMQLAKCLARIGDFGSAVNEFETAAGEAPLRREPLYWAAMEFIRAGHPWDAIVWLEKCIKILPNHMPEFSLYAKELQEGLAETTLLDCKTMIDQAKAAYEAKMGRAS